MNATEEKFIYFYIRTVAYGDVTPKLMAWAVHY